MFGKRLPELTSADIRRVVDDAILEGAEVEFKETLPAGKGRTDPWLDGGGIGDKARNELLEEVIAFANAFGGTLVLGVVETEDKPARAKGVAPIPRCAELADRLRLQCRDCIEPQVPLLEIAGIPMSADGAGVVIFRVPRSRTAPHRHTVTRECYIRRADRTERMTMREIQDLTLQVERGGAAIEAMFDKRRMMFGETFSNFCGSADCYGIRGTAVPLIPVFLDRVHSNPSVRPKLVSPIKGVMGKDRIELFLPISISSGRPLLRGSQASGGTSGGMRLTVEVYGDGLVEYLLFTKSELLVDVPRLYPSWMMCLVANVLCAVERFRRAAGAVDVEWGLELEISNKLDKLSVGLYGGSDYGRWLGPLKKGVTLFPRYSVGPPAEFPALHRLVENDFWNAVGHDFPELATIDYAMALG